MYRLTATVFFLFVLIAQTSPAAESRIFRYPNSSETEIAFCHAGDIFTVPIGGGIARKITSSKGIEMYPRFSPDGRRIAFSGEYDGNRELYVMPSNGGEPKRLTYSMDIKGLPDRMGPDKIIMQWTDKGKKLLYRSRHEIWNAWLGKLYEVGLAGGLPEVLPLPASGFASYSPDGKKIAYNRIFREYRTWKRYRGGQADDIWIYDFESKELENITNNPAQDIIPMWHGDKIYYVSDRDKTMNLFAYDLITKQTAKITNFTDYDVKFPSLGAKHIAFHCGGFVYLMDLATRNYEKVNITLMEDWPDVRTAIVEVKDNIRSYEISPDAKRALFSARGDIFVVPVKEGIVRNLTNSDDAHDRYPKWSPDGKWIAYISDKSGEFEIYIVRPDGSGEQQVTNDAKSYRYGIMWSPDSKKILSSDKTMRLYYIDIESKDVTVITKSKVWEIRDFSWSPDSKWVAYTDAIDNNNSIVYIYSLDDKEIYQVTDEYFNSLNPVFSPGGDYLFFTSDRTFRARVGKFEWNYSFRRLSKIYGVTLKKKGESPFAFKEDYSDADEKGDDEKDKNDDDNKDKKDKKDEKDKVVLKIDTDGIGGRIFEFPVEAAGYGSLYPHKNHKLYYAKRKEGGKPGFYVFDSKTKKEKRVGDFMGYEISADGKSILFAKNKSYYVSKLKEKISADKAEKINVSDMKVTLNRRAEWAQIFDETWRQMRDFFYDPGMHGLDWAAIKKRYAALLPYVDHRADLTFLIGEMIGELNVGHAYVGGGDSPKIDEIAIGLLGAEYELDPASGYYKITKIYPGRNWDEKTRSPLTEPGLDIKEGDYLISIDGVELTKEISPYVALNNKVKKYVKIRASSKPKAKQDDNGIKEFAVKTIGSEKGLRYFDWVETNRKKVDKATGGRVGYIHIPDMGLGNGLNEFVKYFYPQLRKEALIIDDRYNGGGNVSPMIIERLRREVAVGKHARNQELVMTTPNAVMAGPLVCLINELSASDGDLFPYQFKQYGLGKIIGKRSWGGVIGIRGSLPLLDGGYLYKPEFANFGGDGTWVLEGTGMTPDIIVDNLPGRVMDGIDDQLNKAIEVILEDIKTSKKRKIPEVPDFPIKK